MKLPLSWLKNYVDIDCSVDELKAKLFSCGFEVEEVDYFGKNIDKIVTCKILEIEKHPNADKLSVTQVDAGKYGKLQIITAAKNIFVGAVVPVCVDGATLFNGERIFNGELRGLPSYGMFCSGEELGINDDWYPGASVNGILILDENYPLGEEVKTLLDIEDVIFDINVTANRPDCQSILGLSREVAAVLDKPLKMPNTSYKVDNTLSTLNTVKVEDKAFDLCPRYKAHLVKDVKLGESPLWLKRRLFSMGLRSINNIVDITNFVLMEIGQPMHAFDLNDIEGKQIIIRRANDNEKIVTLDEKEFVLNSNNLVIADAVKPVALAGIMGGLNSEIKDNTTAVLFESAKFARDNVRKTSRQLGQKSDSSSRYEKGVDFMSVELGLNRALALIDELGCGVIAFDEYDLLEKPIEEKVIKTTVSKVNGVLGIDIDSSIIKSILEKLNFKVILNGDNLEVTVPLYREDMDSYPDIAEEIIREYGYDKIVPSLLKTSAITNGGRNTLQTKIEDLKNLLVGFGYNEIITYSFVPEKDVSDFGLQVDDNDTVKILNPISEELAVMRRSLLPSIIKTSCYNLNRKNYDGKLFELAKTYKKNPDDKLGLAKEETNLSIACFGDNEDFFTLKGIVESVLNCFCFGSDVEFKNSNAKCMHPTRSAEIFVNGESIGLFGQVNPVLLESLDANKPVYAGEIQFDKLVANFNDRIIFKTVSKFPKIDRDLAVLADEGVSCGYIVKEIKRCGGEFLQSVKLFDIYQGDQVEAGKKSMAFSLEFLSTERTLNVEEVDGYISAKED